MLGKPMKLKPETAAEIEDCKTQQGMRRRLNEYSYRGNEYMVKAIFDSARIQGLSGEDTMTWLAFEALKGMELYKGIVLEQAMRAVHTPYIVRGDLILDLDPHPLKKRD